MHVWGFFGFHHPIGDPDDPFGGPGDVGVMGDQNNGDAFLFVESPEKFQHFFTGLGVEVAGGLIGEQDGGIIDQGPGNGHPLLLPAGELRRFVVQAIPQPYPLEQVFGPLAPLLVGEVLRRYTTGA